MKKNLILCLVAFCAVLFTGCKDENHAEQYVGTYTLVATPHLKANIPMMGTIDLPVAPYNTSCTIALDGDDGKVIATTDLSEDLMHGEATEKGLQFEPANTSLIYDLSEMDLGEVEFTGLLTFPLITFPDGINATWESTINGTVTVSFMGSQVPIPAAGTVSFTATRLAQ